MRAQGQGVVVEGSTVPATAKIVDSGVKLAPSLFRWFRDRLSIRSEGHRSAELFGAGRSNPYTVRLGTSHPLLTDGEPHPDDVAAFRALADPVIARAYDRGVLDYENGILAPLDIGLVLVGGPGTEALTRLVFDYQPGPEGGYLYRGNTLDLPYHWQEDPSTVLEQCRRYLPGGIQVVRPNWPIISQVGERQMRLYPKLSEDGFLETDYLLVTRLPNFLTERGQATGMSIVSIGGAHGVGTRAFDLLLRDSVAVNGVFRQLPSVKSSFQALIEVGAIRHERTGSYATRVRVADVKALNRPDFDWASARRSALRGFTAWAAESDSRYRYLSRLSTPEGISGRLEWVPNPPPPMDGQA